MIIYMSIYVTYTHTHTFASEIPWKESWTNRKDYTKFLEGETQPNENVIFPYINL